MASQFRWSGVSVLLSQRPGVLRQHQVGPTQTLGIRDVSPEIVTSKLFWQELKNELDRVRRQNILILRDSTDIGIQSVEVRGGHSHYRDNIDDVK